MSDNYNNEDVQDPNDLILDYDAGSVEPVSFDLLPDGDYPVLVKAVVSKKTKHAKENNTADRMAAFTFVITDGPAKGRQLFDNFNIINKSEEAQRIGRGQLSGLQKALGQHGEKNIARHVQAECIAVVRTQPAKDGYEARNVIKGYKSLGGAAAAHAAPAAEEKKAAPGFLKGGKQPPKLS